MGTVRGKDAFNLQRGERVILRLSENQKISFINFSFVCGYQKNLFVLKR